MYNTNESKVLSWSWQLHQIRGSIRSNKIHPETNWGMLNDRKINLLLQSTKEIMYDSYLHGGAELKDFKKPI